MNQTEIKFPAEVARVALELGVDLKDRDGGENRASWWRDYDGPFPGSAAPYRLASDKPLTKQQARALGEAWPGSIWTDGRTLHRYVDGEWYGKEEPADWEPESNSLMGWAVPTSRVNLPNWRLVSGPEVNTQAAKSEPQGATLLDCMCYARDNRVQILAKRPGKAHLTVNPLGQFRTRNLYMGIPTLESSDFSVSTDNGATWFNPNDPPQVKPRSGAEGL